jgi:multidrug efflux pump subunit AcrA (membrane-fusion protein)
MFVESTIQGREVPGLVTLPRVALRDGSEPRVLVLEGDVLHFRGVTVLRRQGDIVVISEGLAAGDRVCVSPLEAPTDGMRVVATMDPAGGRP